MVIKSKCMVIKSKCSTLVTKIRVWWIHAFFKCEESALFSYTCHNWCSRTCCVLKNLLRSRTRVTTVIFQNAWCFEESAPFSYTCHNYDDQLRSVFMFAWMYPARCIHYASWIFAKSAPFSYTYAKCEVTRRPWDRQIGVKSASSPPRPKSAPRGSRSTIFVQGIFQSFELRNSS